MVWTWLPQGPHAPVMLYVSARQSWHGRFVCWVISTFAFTSDFPFSGKHIFQPRTRQTSHIGFGVAWLVGCVDGFVFLHGTCVGNFLVLATLNIQVPKLEKQPVLQQTALHQAVYQNKFAALLQSETEGRLPDSSSAVPTGATSSPSAGKLGMARSPRAALPTARWTAAEREPHHRRAQHCVAEARKVGGARLLRKRTRRLTSRRGSSFQRPPTSTAGTRSRCGPLRHKSGYR